MRVQVVVDEIDAEWLKRDIVTNVVEALGADTIRFVGGAVRDHLVDLEVTDIDAATIHKPEQTVQLLTDAGIKAIPTGIEHGTVTAVVGTQTIEITTLRVDVETDGRHAEVAFTADWLEDAKRRDFTFNALYVSADGALFDPFGGRKDLGKGRVVFIGNAEERIKEDGLRILRLFRFQAHFGKVAIAADALAACKKLAPMLKELSVERVRTELAKMLKADNPLLALEAMQEADVLQTLSGGQVSLQHTKILLENESKLAAKRDPLLRLYKLFRGVMGAERLTGWLKLSNKNKKFLLAVEHGMDAPLPEGEIAMRRFIYQHGPEASSAVAVCTGEQQLFQLAKGWEVPKLPVQGRDLMAAGMLGGPAVGETLKQLEEVWIDSDFQLSREELLKHIPRQ